MRVDAYRTNLISASMNRLTYKLEFSSSTLSRAFPKRRLRVRRRGITAKTMATPLQPGARFCLVSMAERGQDRGCQSLWVCLWDLVPRMIST